MNRRNLLAGLGAAFCLGTTGCLDQPAGGDAIVSATAVESVPPDETLLKYSETPSLENSHFARAVRRAVDGGAEVWYEIPRSEGRTLASRLRSAFPGDQSPYFVRYEGTVVRFSVLFEG